ncbi:hypothetical protein PIB30_067335 [Stylosanthes scabra]|uniref:RNase H type-1 domain-containing protein n=1 Tax=Stylosanthes scabra TaxID=79078 RepID=A0ABU6VNJ3_9FABA|nr:hypothetical protein [Stylosanthes scabra]
MGMGPKVETPGVKDSVAWSFSSDGRYSTKSFVTAVSGRVLGLSEEKQIYDGVWNDRVPPRFQLLSWFSINEGLARKDKLVKRKLILWEMVKALVNSWGKVEKQKSKGSIIQGQHEIAKEWVWWNCLLYCPEKKGIVVGGYLTNKLDVVCCMRGDLVLVENMDEATLISLQEGVQFILEEANPIKHEVVVVCYNREIVRWLSGEKDTAWDMRFLRNKTFNIANVFDDFEVECICKQEYRMHKQWDQLANNEGENWCRWFT